MSGLSRSKTILDLSSQLTPFAVDAIIILVEELVGKSIPESYLVHFSGYKLIINVGPMILLLGIFLNEFIINMERNHV